MRSLCEGLLMLGLLGLSAAHGQAAVTVDTSTVFQEITGIGAFGTLSPARPLREQYDTIAFDAGFTIVRHEISAYCQLERNGPFSIDVFVFGGPSVRDNFNKVRALHARGLEVFIGTVWSPPAWMKDNHSTRNGGHLRREYYDDFAEYLITYIQKCREISGVELYAVSLQNELEWAQPFNSCVYTPEDMRDLIKVVKPRFQAAGLRTRIFFPEHMADLGRNERYIDAVLNDPVARAAADIVAVHGYMLDGASPDSPDARNWQTLFAKGDACGMPLWMTETSGYAWRSWGEGMKLATAMYTALRHGRVSAWVWWSYNDPHSSNPDSEVFALSYGGSPTPLYYVHKQFSRFVRPGAVRVEARSSSPEVLPLAFHHRRTGALTLVLINDGEAKTVAVSGSMPNRPLHAFVTGESEMCVDKGMVATGSLALGPYCVTTLTDTVVDLRAACPPALYELELSMPASLVGVGDTLGLTARPVDQYGQPCASAHAIEWQSPDGGTLSALQGSRTTFTARSPGSYRIIARAGDLGAETHLTVYDPDSIHLTINCGGLPYGTWQSDASFARGGRLFYFDTPQDPSGVENAAPAQVYQTVRHTEHAYDIGLPDGEYAVRLHFSDHYGGRAMRYTMENEVVLDGFDVATAAGGLDKAVARDFAVTVADGNGLQIDCSRGSSNDVFECAIEITGAASTAGEPRPMAPSKRMPASLDVRQMPDRYVRIALHDASGDRLVEIAGVDGRMVERFHGSAGQTAYLWRAASPGVYLVSVVDPRTTWRMVRRIGIR